MGLAVSENCTAPQKQEAGNEAKYLPTNLRAAEAFVLQAMARSLFEDAAILLHGSDAMAFRYHKDKRSDL
jgi:hypothetical protein